MDTNLILGYIASFLIGITLGLFGGGGTILTVPVLYYLLHFESDISILYSMFIVGMATFVGGINSYIKHNLNLKAAYSFGIPSLIAVIITRKTITPWIDVQTWTMGSYILTGKHLLMFLFAVLMIVVSLFMIFKKQNSVIVEQVKKKKFYFGIILKALLVGFISGLIGAGGGFIIVPSLMTFYKLNVKEAIGTSLIIIAANSFFGFMGDFIRLTTAPLNLSFDTTRFYANEWSFLLLFSFIAILGIVSGLWIARRVQANRLKIAFGYFVLLMGIYVFFKELF
ncbi:MAG: sulfite exporter TauE/SafE family protein [Bacteroidota bacterium]